MGSTVKIELGGRCTASLWGNFQLADTEYNRKEEGGEGLKGPRHYEQQNWLLQVWRDKNR